MSQRSERILVVGDDAKLRGLLMDALRGGGYQADGVVDGLEAVNRLKAGRRSDPGDIGDRIR